MSLNRRDFLKTSVAGTLVLGSLEHSSRAAEQVNLPKGGKAQSVVYLYMAGGMSHLDSFDIKPDNPEVRGDSGEAKTNADGVRVSKFFPNMAKQMDKVAVINSLTTTQGAHAQGNYFMHTSYTQRSSVQHPHMGAWVSKMLGSNSKTLPAYVKVGRGGNSLGAGFFSGKYGALPIGDPKLGLQYSTLHKSVDQKIFNNRYTMLKEMNKGFADQYQQKLVKSYADAYDDAVALMSSSDLETFKIGSEKQTVKEAYGNNSFGEGCLLARRLVAKGVRFVEVNLGGWDHHNNIYDSFSEKTHILDQAMGALVADLSQRGLLDTTLIVLATEFGRSPVITERNGRNHYPKAFSGLLIGGGLKGGVTYGKTDAKGANVIENKVEVPDFNATIAHAMGLDVNHVEMSNSGRPFRVADKGKVISALF